MSVAFKSRIQLAMVLNAASRPKAPALISGQQVISYGQLLPAVQQLAKALQSLGARRVAIAADNGIAWALADLAALSAGLVCVPLPLFFSAEQSAHALRSAGVDLLLIDRRLPMLPLPDSASEVTHYLPAEHRGWFRALAFPASPVELPVGTCKVTYTSGTTGAPKGVCLGLAEQEAVADALCAASHADMHSRHLCALPLATLLENIGGLYAPLMMGAATHLPPLAEVGLSGASSFDVQRLLTSLLASGADSLILVPQMLQALVVALEHGMQRPRRLQFVAVGGAPVSERLLARAAALDLPVYEGYGLSECASVVALNTPDAKRRGSVGRPLPQVRLQLAEDGEILISGNAFLGYVGEAPRGDMPVATGDLGHLDADGFLHLTGRKKNIFITAYGRNVAPEWVERELCLQPAIAQAAVFGEAAPWNVAVIVPRVADAAVVQAAIDEVNSELPDYARVQHWLPAHAPFTTANDQATANGRLRRSVIQSAYGGAIAALYQQHTEENPA